MASLGLGVSGIAFLSRLSGFRNPLIIATAIVMLLAYRMIEKKGTSRGSRIIFWLSAFLSVLILFLPTLTRLLYRY